MNSCVALREANSHAQGIPFDALSKLEPEEGNAPSFLVYQTSVLLLNDTGIDSLLDAVLPRIVFSLDTYYDSVFCIKYRLFLTVHIRDFTQLMWCQNLVRHVGNAPTTQDWKSRMYL